MDTRHSIRIIENGLRKIMLYRRARDGYFVPTEFRRLHAI